MKQTNGRWFRAEAAGRLFLLATLILSGLAFASLGNFSLGCGGKAGSGNVTDSGGDPRSWMAFSVGRSVSTAELGCDEATLVCGEGSQVAVVASGAEADKAASGAAATAYPARAHAVGETVYVKAEIPYGQAFSVTVLGKSFAREGVANPLSVDGDDYTDLLFFNNFVHMGIDEERSNGEAYIIPGTVIANTANASGLGSWTMDDSGLSGGRAIGNRNTYTNDYEVDPNALGTSLLWGSIVPNMDGKGGAGVVIARFNAEGDELADVGIDLPYWLGGGFSEAPRTVEGGVAPEDGIILRTEWEDGERYKGIAPLIIPLGDVQGKGQDAIATLGLNLVPFLNEFASQRKFDLSKSVQSVKLYTEGLGAAPLVLAVPDGERWINIVGLGDVNVDGIDDFAVTALTYAKITGDVYNASKIVQLGTKVRIFLGSTDPAALVASDLEITSKDRPFEGLGFAVRGSADVTGDAIPDLVVGAPAGFLSLMLMATPTLAVDGVEGLRSIQARYMPQQAMEANASILEKLAAMANVADVDEMMRGSVYVFPGGTDSFKESFDTSKATIVYRSASGMESGGYGAGDAFGQMLEVLETKISEGLCYDRVLKEAKAGCSYDLGFNQMSIWPDNFGFSLSTGHYLPGEIAGTGSVAVGAPTALAFKAGKTNILNTIIDYTVDAAVKIAEAQSCEGNDCDTAMEVILMDILPGVITEINATFDGVGKIYLFGVKPGAADQREAQDADFEIIGDNMWGLGLFQSKGQARDFQNDGADDLVAGGLSLALGGAYGDMPFMIYLKQHTGVFFGGSELSGQTKMSLGSAMFTQDWTQMLANYMERMMGGGNNN